MKKLSIVLALLFSSHAYSGVGDPNPTNCTWKNVECTKGQIPGTRDADVWAPEKGVILYYNGNNQFQVFLYFDDPAVTWYQNNPWAGFEIDILFPEHGNYSLPRIDIGSVRSETDDLMVVRDTIIGDFSTGTRGVTVLNPSKLKRDQWNTFYFSLRDNMFEDLPQNVRISANIQLSANAVHPQYYQALYQYNSYTWYFKWHGIWSGVTGAGLWTGHATPGDGEETFKMFAMAGAIQSTGENESPTRLNSSTQGGGLCWGSNNSDFADVCDSSNFLSIVNSSAHPSTNPSTDRTESSLSEVSNRTIINRIAQRTGVNLAGDDSAVEPGTESEGSGDSDLSIGRFELKESGGSYGHKIIKTLSPGESFYMTGELVLRNKSSGRADDVDIDYRVDHGRDFDTDDTQLDEDDGDVGGNSSITKHMASVKVSVSADGTQLYAHRKNGSIAESFSIVNGQGKFYVFADTENRDTGDDDISSSHSSHNEYGVVRVNVRQLLEFQEPTEPAEPPISAGPQSPCPGLDYDTCMAAIMVILD